MPYAAGLCLVSNKESPSAAQIRVPRGGDRESQCRAGSLNMDHRLTWFAAWGLVLTFSPRKHERV